MKTTQKMYQISGHTKTSNYCGSCVSDKLEEVIANFIGKYPRFKGEGDIRHGNVEREDNSEWFVVHYETWKTLGTFESAKELKNYVGE